MQAPLADCLFDDASFSGIDIGNESFSRKYCVNRPLGLKDGPGAYPFLVVLRENHHFGESRNKPKTKHHLLGLKVGILWRGDVLRGRKWERGVNQLHAFGKVRLTLHPTKYGA